MTEEFIRRNLTTSVAQICSNIGWHTMSSSTLQMMTDILYEYFKDLAQSVKKFSEICKYLKSIPYSCLLVYSLLFNIYIYIPICYVYNMCLILGSEISDYHIDFIAIKVDKFIVNYYNFYFSI